jgi:hypothetical protein|tara:strand:+ start:1073 stop:1225 length:153 start_codon:yes stop_codon:yes gene_type:complete
MGIMKEIYLEMLNRDFQGTPKEFINIWFKENNIDNKKKKNAKKYIHKENK